MPMHEGWLPREGFVADVIFRIIDKTFLSPILLGVLLLVSCGPTLTSPLLPSILTTLFFVSLVRQASHFLSSGVTNNWKSDRYDWPTEIAVVTGGAGGIGGHIVRLLQEKGMKVVVLDILPMSYEAGPNVHYYQVDLTQSARVAEVAGQIREEVGEPTILVNNAGIARGKTILESTDEDLRFTFEVNTFAHYYLVRQFLPSMIRKDHGMVVTVASVASHIVSPNLVDYSSTKAAALTFHEGLAAELKTRYNAPRVRTVIVHQGYTDTALFAGHYNDHPFIMPTLKPETVADAICKQIFSGRSGQVITPAIGRILPLLRAAPNWLQYSQRAKLDKLIGRGFTRREVVPDLKKHYEERGEQVKSSGC